MYFRSMGSTKRTRTNPLGRRDSASVLAGNCMCAKALIFNLDSSSEGLHVASGATSIVNHGILSIVPACITTCTRS